MSKVVGYLSSFFAVAALAVGLFKFYSEPAPMSEAQSLAWLNAEQEKANAAEVKLSHPEGTYAYGFQLKLDLRPENDLFWQYKYSEAAEFKSLEGCIANESYLPCIPIEKTTKVYIRYYNGAFASDVREFSYEIKPPELKPIIINSEPFHPEKIKCISFFDKKENESSLEIFIPLRAEESFKNKFVVVSGLAYGPPGLFKKPSLAYDDYVAIDIAKEEMGEFSVADVTYDEADHQGEDNCVLKINSLDLGKYASGSFFCNYIDVEKGQRKNSSMLLFGENAKIAPYDWTCTQWR